MGWDGLVSGGVRGALGGLLAATGRCLGCLRFGVSLSLFCFHEAMMNVRSTFYDVS